MQCLMMDKLAPNLPCQFVALKIPIIIFVVAVEIANTNKPLLGNYLSRVMLPTSIFNTQLRNNFQYLISNLEKQTPTDSYINRSYIDLVAID